VDLTVIKQGDKIAHQKGWTKPRREPRKPKRPVEPRPARSRRGRRASSSSTQPSLFPDA
jgi:hypothetical protein